MIKIEPITPDLAEGLCRKITADLPEYFGLPEVNEHYAIGARSRLNLAARVGEEYVGLISIDFPYPENANIYWMKATSGIWFIWLKAWMIFVKTEQMTY